MNGSLAAIAFPVVILLLVPVRTLLIPRLSFTSEELTILDGPTASPFVSFVSDIAEASPLTLVVDNGVRRRRALAQRTCKEF